ncbi:MAG: alpha/beta hydrolase [Hyphomicrobiales bacterium]|nr:alpha/beta hydrolase [Hyphomicrobiales bacterium]
MSETQAGNPANKPAKNPALHAPLAAFGGARPPAPRWFEAALAIEPEERRIVVDGVGIETLLWGDVGKPGLLLLHGNGAHAGWWRFIAPFFAADYRVAALSWSGMGGSDWRKDYSLEHFAHEAYRVMEAGGLTQGPVKPVGVGHSFGSFPLAEMAASHPGALRGVVLVDSPFFSPERREQRRKEREKEPQRRRELRPHRVYPTLPEALSHFRFAPLQTCDNLFIADLIARQGLKQAPRVDGQGEGWTWVFDPFLWSNLTIPDLTPTLPRIGSPVAIVRGGRSALMHAEDSAFMLTQLPPGSVALDIPDADHHVMVDQPLAFVAALRGLLAGFKI